MKKKNTLEYRGYIGEVAFDAEAKIFHGDVVGLKDVITFQGITVKELEKAFKDSVNDYLEWCKKRCEKPEKPYSGNIRLRLPANLHAHLAHTAALEGKTLNSFIIDRLEKNT